MDYADRTVIVTGGGSGIGEATVARFAALGARVVVADIDGPAAERVAASVPRALAVQADISDPTQVAAMVQATIAEFGTVDVLVNNAMTCSNTPFLEATADEWQRDLAVNLLGPMLCSQAVLPTMIDNGGGVILNIASVNGLAYFGNESYSAAKAGLVSLTKSIASQFGADGVRCVAVAPGTIATGHWDERLRVDPDLMTRASRWYPMGRVGAMDDVVNALVFLASGAASWITGVTLPVDGGLLAGNLAMATELTRGPQDRG